MAVVLDNETVARGLSEAGVRHGVDIRFLIECDTGYGRNGVQSPQAALDLARTAMKMPRMQFEGLMTFPDRKARDAAIPRARAAIVRRRRHSGAGGLGRRLAGARASVGEISDAHRVSRRHLHLQRRDAGDGRCRDLGRLRHEGARDRREPPDRDRAILDTGSKVLTYEQYYAKGYGRIVEYPDAEIAASPRSTDASISRAAARKPKVGEVVSVIPNHCCVVTNMMDEVYGVRGGKVEAVWPVAARGKVR